MHAPGFEPPTYPYERLDGLRAVAEQAVGGLVDCSIGNPRDPVPEIAVNAARSAVPTSAGYPPSVGSPELLAAASDWLQRVLGVEIPADDIGACVGTKELVTSLPQILSLRDPSRDAVLYPEICYPSYEMGARLARLRGIPVRLGEHWHLDYESVSDEESERALVMWINEPGNPTASVADSRWFDGAVTWARERGILVASDECYVEFAPERTSALAAGVDGVLSVQSVSKRSNLAGGRVGFYAGDANVVFYLREVRKHAGLMVSTSMQAAAAAALGDDDHVAMQRELYRERRDLMTAALGRVGLRHDGGPAAFYLWLSSDRGESGWEIASRLARAGLLVAPGDLYGAAGSEHARLALVQPTERLASVVPNLE